MRKLAIFTGSFSLGIFLSQYLLSAVWLLPCAVGAFLFSCGRLVVPGDWGRRLLLAGVGISLAFGWNLSLIHIWAGQDENLSATAWLLRWIVNIL